MVEVLIQNAQRLNEASREESDGINATLGECVRVVSRAALRSNVPNSSPDLLSSDGRHRGEPERAPAGARVRHGQAGPPRLAPQAHPGAVLSLLLVPAQRSRPILVTRLTTNSNLLHRLQTKRLSTPIASILPKYFRFFFKVKMVCSDQPTVCIPVQ